MTNPEKGNIYTEIQHVVDFILKRAKPETAIAMIDDLKLDPMFKEVYKGRIGLKFQRGWQKQFAYAQGVDEKTVSRRYNKAKFMVSNALIMRIIRALDGLNWSHISSQPE